MYLEPKTCELAWNHHPDSHRSISGCILCVRNVPVYLQSKDQWSVPLGSTKADWIVLSEAVKKILFVLQLLANFKIKVKLPIISRVDMT